MKTNDTPLDEEPIPVITLPEENIPKSRLRLFITIVVTIFVAILVLIDQGLGFWSFGYYWVLFGSGIGLSSLMFGLLFVWNDRQRKEEEETWLERWGEEIGWPLMILAFTIQFVFPLIRPFLLGAILGGSWFLVIWHYRRKNA
jgi:hypothetical protein